MSNIHRNLSQEEVLLDNLQYQNLSKSSVYNFPFFMHCSKLNAGSFGHV